MLANCTVEHRPKGWYFYLRFQGGTQRPYSSMASVTLMIARQLRKEIAKRDGVHQLPD
jgi:hypothetical protein